MLDRCIPRSQAFRKKLPMIPVQSSYCHGLTRNSAFARRCGGNWTGRIQAVIQRNIETSLDSGFDLYRVLGKIRVASERLVHRVVEDIAHLLRQ